MQERSLLPAVAAAALAMGLVGLHSWLDAPLSWLVVTLPVALLLGVIALVAGLLTATLVRRQGDWWPRRAPGLGRSGAGELSWHLRDLIDFLDAHWILAALVLGGCTLTLPLAPFCFLSWWFGVCRAGV
jgi:hypothetical protein